MAQDFSSLAGKTCLVTGGAGFIGKHVVERLLALEAKVVIIDDFRRGGRKAQELWERCQFHWKRQFGQEALLLNHRLAFCHDPYTWYITASGQPYGNGKLPDYIFHLAADMGDIVHNQNHNYDMAVGNLQANLGMAALLESFATIAEHRQAAPPTFVFSSTACCFPHDAPVPTPESAARVCNPEPTNFGYGLGKWTAEQLFTFLAKEKYPQLSVRIARFFNAYGKWDLYLDKAHVVPALIHKAHTAPELNVLGSGHQRRSFVNAEDLTTGLLYLALTPEEDFLAYGQEPDWHIVNIGTLTDHSILEVAQTILHLTQLSIPIIPHPDKPEGYPVRLADVTRLRHLTKGTWLPTDDFVGTVGTMIVDYHERKKLDLLI